MGSSHVALFAIVEGRRSLLVGGLFGATPTIAVYGLVQALTIRLPTPLLPFVPF